MRPIDRLLERLEGVREAGGGYSARCPAHDDRNASLSVSEGQGHRVLIHCHAGCSGKTVISALGMTWNDLFARRARRRFSIRTTYDYTDANGEIIFQVVRMIPKSFRQRRPDGNGGWIWNLKGITPPLYRLPKVLEADGAVFVVEGEKDVAALESLGLVATCNAMGAGAWKDRYAKTLQGGYIVVLPDHDSAGHRHAIDIAESLYGQAETRIVHLPVSEGGDPYDWIKGGGTVQELRDLVRTTPAYRKPHDLLRDALGYIERLSGADAQAFARDLRTRLSQHSHTFTYH